MATSQEACSRRRRLDLHQPLDPLGDDGLSFRQVPDSPNMDHCSDEPHNLTGMQQLTEHQIERDEHAASHVELSFRDQYLSRADMWRLMSQLSGQAIFESQELTFLDTIKATVKAIYIDGHRAKSALFGEDTRPIFRSESARFVLYLQMSREMWEFDSAGRGEILFDKVVNDFLPDLFERWDKLKARHLVTIVLFTRMLYPPEEHEAESDEANRNSLTSSHSTAHSLAARDYYRVVVNEMGSDQRLSIVEELKKEFKIFLRDCSLLPERVVRPWLPQDMLLNSFGEDRMVIAGKPAFAIEGNILEAINLAMSQFSKDHIDRDLIRTGLSIIVITPGSGVFQVQEELLRQTTENLIMNGIGIDLVCAGSMPLHTVPFFRFHKSVPPSVGIPHSQGENTGISLQPLDDRNHTPVQAGTHRVTSEYAGPLFRQDWTNVFPFWMEVSYLGEQDRQREFEDRRLNMPRGPNPPPQPFIPRMRMYSVQMMGITDSERSDISIPYLHETNPGIYDSFGASDPFKWMEEYDRYIERGGVRGSDEHGLHATPKQSISQPWLVTTSSASKAPPASSSSTNSIDSSSSPISDRPGSAQKVDTKTSSGLTVSTEKATPAAPIVQSLKPSKLRFSFGFPGKAGVVGPITSSTSVAALAPSDGHKDSNKASSDDIIGISASQPGSVSRQVRASLTRHASHISSNSSLNAQTTSASRSIMHENKDNIFEPPSPDPDAISVSKHGPMQQRRAQYPMLQEPTPKARSSPWLTEINPYRPEDDNGLEGNEAFGRWSHVHPHTPRAQDMKWKSLCGPAALPLTNSYMPSPQELRTTYEEGLYKVSVNEDTDDPRELRAARTLLVHELVGIRLSHGFQIVVGPKVKKIAGKPKDNAGNIFAKDFMASDGAAVFMSKGDVMHQIACVTPGELHITRYSRKVDCNEDRGIIYTPVIRTMMADAYKERRFELNVSNDSINWSYVDNYVAGHHEDFSQSLRAWSARFVLIPVTPPANARRNLQAPAGDLDEELRIDGIHKLTQTWQRNRYVPEELRQQLHLKIKQKDANPLAIEYQTRDPAALVAAGLDATALSGDGEEIPSQLFSDADLYQLTPDLDLHKLADDLQGDKGIKVEDRRWHFKTHKKCFVGSHLVTWLLGNFADVETREEAEELGNTLMKRGLFVHVQDRHKIRDGNYFYSIAAEYRSQQPSTRSGWFGTRTTDRSVPSTPVLAAVQDSPQHQRNESRRRADTRNKTKGKPTVKMSGVLDLNVDPRKKSHRAEVVKLHYDRLHNPDNCYHIRLEWLNVTAKLIEDAVISWASTAERYGLRLVELPIAEASAINETNPFSAPFLINLAIQPPSESCFGDSIEQDPFAGQVQHFHKALLRKFNFVLDQEAASLFPKDVDVHYSWGRPNYRYTQFIHESGLILAQITDEGNILILANRLYSNRVIGSVDQAKTSAAQYLGQRPGLDHKNKARLATERTHLSRVVLDPHLMMVGAVGDRMMHGATPEQVKTALEKFCSNEDALSEFFEHVADSPSLASNMSTPRQGPVTPRMPLPLHLEERLEDLK
ncbi:hypothetical protein MRB53_038928 [Persea americana]|nr:hypothetical protein MRB53_038928 [Persea americana]